MKEQIPLKDIIKLLCSKAKQEINLLVESPKLLAVKPSC